MRWVETIVTSTLFLATPSVAFPFPSWPFGGGSVNPNPGVGSSLSSLINNAANNLRLWDLENFNLGGCNYVQASLNPRQEWRTLSLYQRQNFIDAMRCMMNKPSSLAGNPQFPGVKSRYDEFVAEHIQQAPFVHFSGLFLTWHRYLVWTMEQDLRNICGYQGSMPYWDWTLDANDIQSSPLFNGEQGSMGSNGAYVDRDFPIVFQLPLTQAELEQLPPGISPPALPPNTGTGGGCDTSGPFSHHKVHLGPNLLSAYGNTTGLGSLAYNPRCLKRDLNPWVGPRFLTEYNVTNLITSYSTIDYFQGVMQADPRYDHTEGDFGLHAGGHVFSGGDPFADLPSSNGDPIWYLHHAQLDRIWSIWQGQNLDSRLSMLSGTQTILNIPPSPNVTSSTTINLGYVGGAGTQQLSDLWNTIRGPFCYVYQ